MRIVTAQKEDEERERQEEAAKKAALMRHRKDVEAQMGKNAECRHKEKLDYMEEGRKLRQKIEDNRDKVKRIQGEKIG